MASAPFDAAKARADLAIQMKYNAENVLNGHLASALAGGEQAMSQEPKLIAAQVCNQHELDLLARAERAEQVAADWEHAHRASWNESCKFRKYMKPDVDNEYETEMRSFMLRTGGQGREPRTGGKPVVQAAPLANEMGLALNSADGAVKRGAVRDEPPTSSDVHAEVSQTVKRGEYQAPFFEIPAKPALTSPVSAGAPTARPPIRAKRGAVPARPKDRLSFPITTKTCRTCGNPEGFLCGHDDTGFPKKKDRLSSKKRCR